MYVNKLSKLAHFIATVIIIIVEKYKVIHKQCV